MLEREGGVYRNSAETDTFLDKAKPSYIGGVLEMANTRLYGFWGSLTEALRTGEHQNEGKHGEDFFAAMYAKPEVLHGFLTAMSGISAGAAHAIAAKFRWDDHRSFVDIGAAQGMARVVWRERILISAGSVSIFLEFSRNRGVCGRAGVVGSGTVPGGQLF